MFSKILKLFNFLGSTASVTANELKKNLAKKPKNIVLLDVRSPEEFLAGHIPKAINIDVRSPKFMQKIEQLDKEKTYYVYCRSGARSLMACKMMSNKGFTNLFNVRGGFLSWSNQK